MKRSPSLARIAALVAFTIAAAPLVAQEATLRYHWTKGETIGYRINLLTDSAITGMPGVGDMQVGQTLTQVVRMSVDDVAADGTATLRQTFESVKLEVNGPMGRIAYDTASPSTDSNPMVQSLKQVLGAMAGESVIVVQAPDGTVTKVEGASRIADKIAAGLGQDPGAAMMVQGLKSMLSDEAMKATLEQSFARLPARPVKVGDTWNGDLNLGNETVGKIAGSVTFTLKAIDGPPDAGTARIGVAVLMKQLSTPPPGPNGLVVKLGDWRGEGEMTFDLARGRIQTSTMTTDMPSTMTMQAPDGTTATMQNTTKTTMTMELIAK